MESTIEKKSFVLASPERVWAVLTDPGQLAIWFGAELDAPLRAGTRVGGRMTPTNVLPQVARRRKPYTGLSFTMDIERAEPLQLLVFRWSPFAFFNPDVKTTGTSRVTIEITPDPRGSRVSVSEGDLDGLPVEMLAEVIKANTASWSSQMLQLELFLSGAIDLRPIKD